ncbi:transmembrane protein, putative [Rhizoctonia solani AG-3 Rhs1AP]|uniref:Transmembrane protein, putative n=1 Tax=Rhizoctonia solani AG-3 Rhs1AP TaxID=1086054 RepID=X8J3S6_9AGAM|nr:transmembrane protein, putative [Rhizoctonia solani AG-3 Rhs1AP]
MEEVTQHTALESTTKKRTSHRGWIFKTFWIAACILTLGYSSKYHQRILRWQKYDPSNKDAKRRAYSTLVTSQSAGFKSSERAKQQKEWDRLIMPLSVITATSAAALAIPSPFDTPNLNWVATALYVVAFGLSLEGLLLIMYLTVFGAGSDPEMIGRLASGKGFLVGMSGPVAFVTALPTAITTYSSLFLLAGLLVMTIAADNSSDIKDHKGAFQAIVLVPVGLMLFCLLGTIAGCEWFAHRERHDYKYKKARDEGSGMESVTGNGSQIHSEPEGMSDVEQQRRETVRFEQIA